MDIITSHMNADFDALASAAAAKKLYPDAVIVFPGSLEKKARDFIDAFQPIEIKKLKDVPLEKVKRLIIVDTKHPDRIGRLKEILSNKSVKIHIYDHHPINKEDIRGEVEVIKNTGAVSTIFTEIIQKKNIPITPLEATLLCLGIYEETGSLSYTSTTPADLMAAAYLLKRGANLNIVSNFLKVEMTTEEFALLNELMQSIKEVVIHGVRIKIARGTMEGFGDAAHLAHKIMDMEETDGVILLISMADKVLIVARSKAHEMDVSLVLSVFGGGGHPTAASATIKDMPFEIIEEKLIESLNKHIRPVKMARDVMTTPVIVIQCDNSIKEAEGMMTRYGVNVLPVVKPVPAGLKQGQDKYTGILTREAVEKALYHGFGKSPCLDFTTTDVITASLDTPVSDIEASMIEQNQRFVPVIEEDRMVGAITRTDILRSLYDDFLRKSRITTREYIGDASGLGKNISKIMIERLSPDLYEFIRTAGDIAEELGFNTYLVGGCVRDLVMGEKNIDVDFVVEGDAILYAKELGKKIGAKVIVHQKFGTAQIILPKDSLLVTRYSLQNIDIATARTEYYESPAALPKVEVSSIKKDLYRRDFTINTMAVKINKKDFGLLIDFFGGHRDLKDKVIRALHNLSFVEDPTRAFRAVRFSERFGFKLTKHTQNLIKVAIRLNIFEKLSGTRIYDEMMLIFNETNPVKAIKRLADYNLLKVIHPQIVFSQDVESLLQSVHDTISWFELLFLKETYDKGLIYLMSLLYKLPPEERESALTRLLVPLKIKKVILRGVQFSDELLRRLNPYNAVEIYHLLKGHNIETLLFSMALTHDTEKKKAISQFLLVLRNVKPLLKGNDLKALGIPPGPVYSKIFEKILDEKLMKRLNTKEEEIEFVKNLL